MNETNAQAQAPAQAAQAPVRYKSIDARCSAFLHLTLEERAAKLEEWKVMCSDRYEDGRLKVMLPSMERLANFLNVTAPSIYTWKKSGMYPEIEDICDWILREQKIRLMENGLAGSYNANMAKMMLACNHGMYEKQIVDQTVTTVQPIMGGMSMDTNSEGLEGSNTSHAV